MSILFFILGSVIGLYYGKCWLVLWIVALVNGIYKLLNMMTFGHFDLVFQNLSLSFSANWNMNRFLPTLVWVCEKIAIFWDSPVDLLRVHDLFHLKIIRLWVKSVLVIVAKVCDHHRLIVCDHHWLIVHTYPLCPGIYWHARSNKISIFIMIGQWKRESVLDIPFSLLIRCLAVSKNLWRVSQIILSIFVLFLTTLIAILL